jgi:sugar lactone lactonase YvrE
VVIERRHHDWGVELGGFGRPFGLAIDAARRLHVTDMDRHCIVRFAPDLATHEVIAKPGVWNGPHSVDFAPDGRAIVTCYYTPGIYEMGSGVKMTLARELTGPASAFFDASGRLLVAEYAQNAILAFAGDGRLDCEFAGQFDRPHMARQLPDGSVLVADTWNNKLQRFDAGGAVIDAQVATVSCPVAIDIDPDRGWLVTAWGDNGVVRFDARGSAAGRLHTPPLEKPYDARWLDQDRVAVADSHHGRVLVLTAPRFH